MFSVVRVAFRVFLLWIFKVLCFFFFKQKTAYEILTCDWSSDVCSSDLIPTKNYNAEDDVQMARWLDSNMDQLRKELPKLYSLIGIHSDRLKALPNLLYISGPYGHNQTLARQVGPFKACPGESGAEPAAKRQKVTRWNSVVEYTNEWHNAHGTSFFYPETSIHNIRFTKIEQREFRDCMIALHRDSDSDSQIDIHVIIQIQI